MALLALFDLETGVPETILDVSVITKDADRRTDRLKTAWVKKSAFVVPCQPWAPRRWRSPTLEKVQGVGLGQAWADAQDYPFPGGAGSMLGSYPSGWAGVSLYRRA